MRRPSRVEPLLAALLLGLMTGCMASGEEAEGVPPSAAPAPEAPRDGETRSAGRAQRESTLVTTNNLGPFTATGETRVSGTLSGDYTATQASDAASESITEINTGSGKSRLSQLEHHWTVSGITATANLLVVVAHQNGSTDRDNFVFSYSTNGTTWTNAITVATTVKTATRFEAPLSLGGASTVYVRVLDADRTAGAIALDTLVVNYLAVDIKSTCGNRLVEGRETCDDGNTQSCDGCTSACQSESLQGWYADADGDSYGSAAGTPQSAYCAPAGRVASNTDCDDANAAIRPGAAEVCGDGRDQNCDGADQPCICGDGTRGVTEACDDGNTASCDGCSANCQTVESLSPFYPDADGDGFGARTGAVSAYCASASRVASNTDCNDAAASVYPGATDLCADGIDQDCNGQDRTCVLGSSCTQNSECPTGFCADGVCCESACGSACQTCNAPLGTPGLCTAQQDMTTDAACGAYTCSGGKCASSCLWMGSVPLDALCTAGNYCGRAGTCLPKKANGKSCAAVGECTSGVCADGVCCDGACGGACDACNVPGREGMCSPSPAGTSGTPACAPYVCNGTGTECPTSCVTNANCIGNSFCEAGTCKSRLDVGQACTSSQQCGSGFCVDGYCCNSACNGACDACDLPGSYGSCSIQPAGTPGEPSCSPYVCDGSKAVCPTRCTDDTSCVERSTCDLATSSCTVPSGLPNGEACTSNTECQNSLCVDGVCCDTACEGSCNACNLAGSEGVCTNRPAGSAGQPSCNPNLCGGQAQCATSCTSNADCAGGLPCHEGVCAVPFALSRGWGGMESVNADNPAAKLRVYIETATRVRLHVHSASSDLAISLINPVGQEISVEEAASMGIQVSAWDSSSPAFATRGGSYSLASEGGAHVVFDMLTPSPGAWYVKLNARTRPVTSTLVAEVRLTTDGQAGVALVTNKTTYARGEPVLAWLHVRNLNASPPTPMTGASAKLSFLEVYRDPAGKPPVIPPKPFFQTIDLLDDGAGAGASGDATQGDGLYTGKITLTKAAMYIVSAEVRGTDSNGHVWVRTSTNFIDVK